MPITEENFEISYIDYQEYFEVGVKCKGNVKQSDKTKLDFKSAIHLKSKIYNIE